MFAKCSASSKAHEVAPETLVKYHTERANLERKKKSNEDLTTTCKIFLDPQKLSLRFQVAFKDAFLPSAPTILPRLWNVTLMLSQTDGRQAASHTHSQHPKPQPQLQPLAPAVAFGYRVLLERNAEHGTERYGISLYIKKNPTNKPTNKNKAANNTSLKMRFQVCGILTPVLQLLKSTELCNDCP